MTSGVLIALHVVVIPLHPLPLRGFDYRGKYRYFITFCTYYRRPLFTSMERVDLARTQILRAAEQESFDLIAYCFMPDHVHLLVCGSLPSSDCRRFIARAKQFSGFYQKEFHDRLWQRYSYEQVLRPEEDTFRFARYILENPVRAGLVRAISDYPYLGSSGYTIDQILNAR